MHGDLVVRLLGAHRVLGGHADTAQRQVLGGLPELLRVDRAEHLGELGGDRLLHSLRVRVLHGLDARGGLGAQLLDQVGHLLGLLHGQVGGAGGEVEGSGVGEGLLQVIGDGHVLVLPDQLQFVFDGISSEGASCAFSLRNDS